MFEQNISRNVDWIWCPVTWVSWFIDLTPMELVILGHLKGHVYTVHAKTVDLMARLDTGVTDQFEYISVCVREYHLAHCCLPGSGQRLL